MMWSKLKVMAEELLCDSLKGRLEYRAVVHRKSHDQTGTFRITLDGTEIFRASDIPYANAVYERGRELADEREIDPLAWAGSLEDLMESEEIKKYHAAYDDAADEMKEASVLAAWDTKQLLFDYVQLPFEELLKHENSFLRALCLFDRRYGKRKLKEVDAERENELYRRFYKVRLEADQLYKENSST